MILRIFSRNYIRFLCKGVLRVMTMPSRIYRVLTRRRRTFWSTFTTICTRALARTISVLTHVVGRSLQLTIRPRRRFPCSLYHSTDVKFSQGELVGLIGARLGTIGFLICQCNFNALTRRSILTAIPRAEDAQTFTAGLCRETSYTSTSRSKAFSIFILHASLRMRGRLRFFFFRYFLLTGLRFFRRL